MHSQKYIDIFKTSSFFRSSHQSYTDTTTIPLGGILFVSIKSIPYKRLNDQKTKKTEKQQTNQKTQENLGKQNTTKQNNQASPESGPEHMVFRCHLPHTCFFIFCFSNSSITLPAMGTSISGQILRCSKSRVRDHFILYLRHDISDIALL